MPALTPRWTAFLRAVSRVVGALALLWLIWPQSLGGTVAYVRVDGQSMAGTYADGDLVVVRSQPRYSVGDSVAYRIPEGAFGAGAPVIHRLTGGDGEHGYITQGDNKPTPDPWRPREGDILGKAWLRVPAVGTTLEGFRSPVALGALCGVLAMITTLMPSSRKTPRTAADTP